MPIYACLTRPLDAYDQRTVGRILANLELDEVTGCWNWTRAKTAKGYGVVGYRPGHGRAVHRVLYQLLVAPIPRELTCDHLCRNTSCSNPSHIEIVTNRENILRGDTLAARQLARDHCIHGHPLTPENVYPVRPGRRNQRMCITCARERARGRRTKAA